MTIITITNSEQVKTGDMILFGHDTFPAIVEEISADCVITKRRNLGKQEFQPRRIHRATFDNYVANGYYSKVMN